MRDLIAIALSLILALAAAVVIFAWWRSPIPTFVIFTAVLHGLLLGAALMWLLDRLAIRSPTRRALVAMIAAVVSVIALVFAQYVSDAHAYRDRTLTAMSAFFPAQQRPTAGALAHYDRSLLEPATGHTGLIGYVALQNRDDGWRRWLRMAEALLVVIVATGLAARAQATDSPPG